MPSCLGCGSRPHLANCPEDASLSRQRRWQLRQKQAGNCVTCGKKVKRKVKTKLGERTMTECSECGKFRQKKEQAASEHDNKAA